MTALHAMLQALASTRASQVLATVVKVEGSAYRRPGARMLIGAQGLRIGTLSGGCLEAEVAKKADWLTADGQPCLQRYSSAEDDDDLDALEYTFGLGCNGTVHVLLERLPDPDQYLPVQLLREVQASGQPAVLATVIGVSGPLPVLLAERFALDCNRQPRTGSTVLAGLPALQQDLQTALHTRRTSVRRYALAGGELEVLVEYLAAPRRLVIFGAGHDALPLLQLATSQGWRVSVIDSRSHFARAERFPGADQVLNLAINTPVNLHALLDGAAVAVMTHSYAQDLFWLQQALNGTPAYIGQLGPRYRTERLLAQIAPAPSRLAHLHYPMGLDLGGDGPEAVALAVLAEITAVFNERSGQRLKQRDEPIHASELHSTVR
ncbi:XdhC family protein [Pseudomonas sp. SDO528_S397]